MLEELWLPSRKGPNDLFYKGLIQLAGAFVHFQKDRLRPAGALLILARDNLAKFPGNHEGLVLGAISALIRVWLERLAKRDGNENPFGVFSAPQLDIPIEIESSTTGSIG